MFEQFKKREDGEPEKEHPRYVPPAIITYDGDDLIEELGPAQTCTSDNGSPGGMPPGF